MFTLSNANNCWLPLQRFYMTLIWVKIFTINYTDCKHVPGGGQVPQQASSLDCESCPFDFTGALTSLYVMLVVLLAVLMPMLIVLILVIVIRCCCPKYARKSHNPRSESDEADIDMINNRGGGGGREGGYMY